MAGFGIAKKGLGLLGRSVAGKKAAGRTKKIIKTYSTGRRQTEYVRPKSLQRTPRWVKKAGVKVYCLGKDTPKKHHHN